MRHKVKSQRLGRKSNQRKALLRNLLSSLILHESIKTTKPKAKLTAQLMDRLITKAKWKDKMNAIRYVKRFIFTPEAWTKLVDDIAKRYIERNSWYTRIVALGTRPWDNANTVQLQFV